MSCDCQVKDRDPQKPCPSCGAEPRVTQLVSAPDQTSARVATLLRMMKPGKKQ